jgi:hypothetical protein
MDRSGIQTAFDDVLDQALVFHGFTRYLRDYDIFMYVIANPRTETAPQYLRYRFRYCVRASVTSALSPQIWSRSLDEQLVDYDRGSDLDGYLWGVQWQNLYPGMELVDESTDAQQWFRDLDLPFYEAIIETNVQKISLVFADLVVDVISGGYAPFAVPDNGTDFITSIH